MKKKTALGLITAAALVAAMATGAIAQTQNQNQNQNQTQNQNREQVRGGGETPNPGPGPSPSDGASTSVDKSESTGPAQPYCLTSAIFGSNLMTDAEKTEYRDKLCAVKKLKEQRAFLAEHKTKMQARATEKGVTAR
jgi:hypothetical protein